MTSLADNFNVRHWGRTLKLSAKEVVKLFFNRDVMSDIKQLLDDAASNIAFILSSLKHWIFDIGLNN